MSVNNSREQEVLINVRAYEEPFTSWVTADVHATERINLTNITSNPDRPCIDVELDQLQSQDLVIKAHTRPFSRLMANLRIQGLAFQWDR